MKATRKKLLLRQRGLTALEVLVVLIVSISALALSGQWMSSYSDNLLNQAAAEHAKTVADAATRYIKENHAAVTAVATPAQPAVITMDMLRNTHCLPDSFFDANNHAYNPYGQAYSILALEPVAGQLQTLIVTTGGNAISELNLRRAAQLIGAKGGHIAGTNATGSYGGWTIPLAGYNIAPGPGHLAVALFFQDGALVSDYLYRNAVAGHPELNTMTTPLIMRSVQTLGGDCVTTAAIAQDGSGALLSCQGGTWKLVGDGKCVWTGADLNIVQTDGRCYNGAGNANSPAGGDWFFLEVYRHINAGNYYSVQRLMGMTGASVGKVWHRNQQSGVSGTGWSGWVQQADSKVSIWDQPAEGGVVTITGNDGTAMHIQTVSGGKIRFLNSPWNAELASIDQSGNLTLNQSGATNVGYVNPGWAVETWGCAANGSIAKSAYNIVDGWAWNGKTLTCQNGTWSSAVTAATVTIGTTVAANTPCSPNGKIAKDSTGMILSCQSGVWKSGGTSADSTCGMVGYSDGSGGYFGNGASCQGHNPRISCPAGYVSTQMVLRLFSGSTGYAYMYTCRRDAYVNG